MTTVSRALAFAIRSLIRQPGRASVGILGIAAVGALLFDMLLLSRGLMVSFRDLLDSVGFDIRVMATDAGPMAGARLVHATALAAQLSALPEVAEVVPIRLISAEASVVGGRIGFSLLGVKAGDRRPWTLASGEDLETPGSATLTSAASDAASRRLLINRLLATFLKISVGDSVAVAVTCESNLSPLPPIAFRLAGIADFPFDDASQLTAAASLAVVTTICGRDNDMADMVLVASSEGHGSEAAVSAIRRIRPELHPATNEEIVARMQQTGFTYFRQISTVLSTITLLFGFLLITVLLTVSVNQRIAEIAALRALGFSRARVAADVLWQSALLVGSGGALALPLGAALSIWLDAILKAMPGIPAALHFFVFEPRALVLHASLLVVTAVLAAVYPMRLVAALPIAATLRNEVIS
jgi:putative ABC transport system permease protein